MAFGPAAGLERVDTLTSEPTLQAYHLLPSVRGDFLARLGRFEEARVEFDRAAGSPAMRASAHCSWRGPPRLEPAPGFRRWTEKERAAAPEALREPHNAKGVARDSSRPPEHHAGNPNGAPARPCAW